MDASKSPAVITYRRVSTEEQGLSHLGLDAQQSSITAELERRGWTAAADYTDIASGKTTIGRPGLSDAVSHAKRERGILVAAKLDRVSRDVIDFASLLSRAEREHWRVLVLDLPLDTTTASGRFTALTLANAAELERRLIGERTKAALAVKKVELAKEGKRLGRRVATPTAVLVHVASERDSGKTWQAIADGLNADGVPTVRGGKRWMLGTVQAAYRTAMLDREAVSDRDASRNPG